MNEALLAFVASSGLTLVTVGVAYGTLKTKVEYLEKLLDTKASAELVAHLNDQLSRIERKLDVLLAEHRSAE